MTKNIDLVTKLVRQLAKDLGTNPKLREILTVLAMNQKINWSNDKLQV
jgi:hypothetical protein